MATWDNSLPNDEELNAEEINLSSAALRAGAFHMGKYCENQNNVSPKIIPCIITSSECCLF